MNFAASVGLSIAALAGTNARLIGENSYFAAKNNTLHAKVMVEQAKEDHKDMYGVTLEKGKSFKFQNNSIKETNILIDEIIKDAEGIRIGMASAAVDAN